MHRALMAALVATAVTQTAGAEPRFVDRAPDHAFTHQYSGEWEHYVGGGVAVFDCNGDFLPDVFAAGGASPALLLVNETSAVGGALKFAPAQESALAQTGVTGAYPLDIDSDGITDLAVLRVGENLLYKGLGDCRFERANEAWGFDGLDRWTTAFSATWEPGQTFPTLAFGNYVDRDNPDGPFFACDTHQLYRPTGQSYGTPTTLSPGFCALSMLFSDWSQSGRQDLRVSNDRHYYVRGGQEQLWRLDETPSAYTEAEGWVPISIWGMGIASRDLTGDGLPEVFLTSIGDQKMRNLAQGAELPTYENASFDSGTTAHVPYLGDEGRPSTGWHAAFGDVNNDGLDDLFIAKGNVNQMPDAAIQDPNNLLMQVSPGTFEEFGAAANLSTTERSRGAALVDLNADGLLDVVVNNRRAALELHQNIAEATGNWVALLPKQSETNTDAVGAWIAVTDGNHTWHREITVGGGHVSGQLGFQHFGTGASRELKVRITWPDGAQSPWHSVESGHHFEMVRGAPPKRVSPAALSK